MDTIDFYAQRLRVNKHALDDALEEQAEYQWRIGDKVEELGYEVSGLTEGLKRREAMVFAERKEAGDADKLAGENVKRDTTRMKMWDELDSAQRELGRWKALYEAWKARGHTIREMGALYQSQYFMVSPNSNAKAAPPRRDYSTGETRTRTRTRT